MGAVDYSASNSDFPFDFDGFPVSIVFEVVLDLEVYFPPFDHPVIPSFPLIYDLFNFVSSSSTASSGGGGTYSDKGTSKSSQTKTFFPSHGISRIENFLYKSSQESVFIFLCVSN